VSEPAPPKSRMGTLTFVTVSAAALAGVTLAGALIGITIRADNTVPLLVSLLALPMPGLAAALGFLFANRFESGRKVLAALAVFFGTMASVIVFALFSFAGLILASLAAGGFGILARRLLDPPLP